MYPENSSVMGIDALFQEIRAHQFFRSPGMETCTFQVNERENQSILAKSNGFLCRDKSSSGAVKLRLLTN
jgi:hypothetical protein